MKIPDKCKAIEVLYEDSTKESFTTSSKTEEFDDSYEFEEKNGEDSSVIVLMKREIRTIRFVKE